LSECSLGVAGDGAPAVQLAVMIAAATATSGPARFMPSLSGSAAPPRRGGAARLPTRRGGTVPVPLG